MRLIVLPLVAVFIRNVFAGDFDDKVPDYVLHIGQIFINEVDYGASYSDESHFGFSIDANDNYMSVGGSYANPYGLHGVFAYNSTAGGYNDIVYTHGYVQSEGYAVAMSKDSNNFMAARTSANANHPLAYRTTDFGSVTIRNLNVGDMDCIDTYPCDVIGISLDGRYAVTGWADYTVGTGASEQGGFIRVFDCNSGTSCSPKVNVWPDGHGGDTPQLAARGRDPNSRLGTSVHASRDYNDTADLYLAGGPGNTEQEDDPAYAVYYDYGGNNGDWRYGGYVKVCRYVGGELRILQHFWAPDGDTTAAIDNKFGSFVRLTPDGHYAVVTAPGHKVGAETRGAFYVYQNVRNSYAMQDGFTLFKGPYVGPVADEKFGWSASINSNATRIFIGAPDANGGDGKVYSYTFGDDEFNLQGDFVDETTGNAGNLGISIYYDESRNRLFAGVPYTSNYSSYVDVGKVVGYDVPSPPTPAPTLSPTPPTPAPTASPTVSPTIEVGKTQIQYNVKNGAGRQSIAQNTIADVKSRYSTPENLIVRVQSTETSATERSVYEEVNNKTLYEESYAKARGCWPDCTVNAIEDRRQLTEQHLRDHGRELQTSGYMVVEVIFDLSEAAYNELVTDGNNLDDPQFITDLATELGVSADNITVTVDDGEVVIEITLLAQVTNEPSGEDTLADLQAIQASLNNATQVLVDEFDEPGSTVTLVELDLCGSRDCSGYGDSSAAGTDSNGCTTSTGVCVCTDDRWGINCEAPCACNNGGYCANSLCHCDYPYYGLRCDDVKTCGCS